MQLFVAALFMNLAAPLMRRAVRMRIGTLGLAAMGAVLHLATALAVETGLGFLAADMANGVLFLGQRKHMRIAAGLGSAAILAVLLVMLFMLFFVT